MNTHDNDKKRGLRFDATISLGHVLTFAGFIISGFMAWSNVDKRVAVLETQQTHQVKRDDQQDTYIREQLNEIRRLLERIENKVDRK